MVRSWALCLLPCVFTKLCSVFGALPQARAALVPAQYIFCCASQACNCAHTDCCCVEGVAVTLRSWRDLALWRCRYLALRWGAAAWSPCPGTVGLHSQGLQAQSLYDCFSQYMRRVSPVPVPIVLPPVAAAAAAASAAQTWLGQHNVRKTETRRRGWFGGRASKRNRNSGNSHQSSGKSAAAASATAAVANSTISEGAASIGPATASAEPRGHALPPSDARVVEGFIQDKQWGAGPRSEASDGSNSTSSKRALLAKVYKRSASAQSLANAHEKASPPATPNESFMGPQRALVQP